jgi:hypothetical protein
MRRELSVFEQAAIKPMLPDKSPGVPCANGVTSPYRGGSEASTSR